MVVSQKIGSLQKIYMPLQKKVVFAKRVCLYIMQKKNELPNSFKLKTYAAFLDLWCFLFPRPNATNTKGGVVWTNECFGYF